MEEVPLLKTLNAKYSKDAVILGISVDVSLDRVDRTIKSKGMTWPQLADGKGFDGAIPAAYRIQGTPALFVLDRAGRIFAKPGSAAQIEAQLKEALAQASPR
jgi:peroxiredoxin